MKFKFLKNVFLPTGVSRRSGQTLIEVLAALTAAAVIIAAIISSAIGSLNNSEFSRDTNLAAQFSQQGIEIIRNMRNTNITSISLQSLPDSTYCFAKSCTALVSSNTSCWQKTGNSCGQNVDKFIREVKIVHNSTDCNATPTPLGQFGVIPSNVKATVAVYWSDTKCTSSGNLFCHANVISSCFSDFTVVTTP